MGPVAGQPALRPRPDPHAARRQRRAAAAALAANVNCGWVRVRFEPPGRPAGHVETHSSTNVPSMARFAIELTFVAAAAVRADPSMPPLTPHIATVRRV